MIERPEHRRALRLLEALDGALLDDCECLFGGGTAISLRCHEARISRDIDFLCASVDGYKRLREFLFGKPPSALFRRPIEAIRELRSDRYGVRTAVRIDEVPIKIEIVSEGRIPLSGVADPALPVRRLTDIDLVAEKLLANTDRGLDDVALGRDVIDLVLLEEALGGLPLEAFDKARGAYGAAIDRAYERTRAWLGLDPKRLARFLDVLDASASAKALVERALLRGSDEAD